MQTVSIIREKFMKKIIVTFIATITAALLLCFSVSAFDNNDYGGGGGYDFGGEEIRGTRGVTAAAVTFTAAAATAVTPTLFPL